MLQTPEAGMSTHCGSVHCNGSRPRFCLQGPFVGGKTSCAFLTSPALTEAQSMKRVTRLKKIFGRIDKTCMMRKNGIQKLGIFST